MASRKAPVAGTSLAPGQISLNASAAGRAHGAPVGDLPRRLPEIEGPGKLRYVVQQRRTGGL
ncbi:hypothetical protein TPA0598_03_05440 [Streptomyces lydicamycinicus]|uniref:Uncharacterized protein n=1 Tax=Streptomyces lydicamycinicus TaxID=1546107 RepID=A0A0N7YL82_9ACTN|nr:hypothetical protein TPA0598_03_05440 [Streptomyces lydicamycinicus]